MKKKFKLPKPFAEKWLEALRGGDYQQGKEQLIVLPDDVESSKSIDALDFKECRFCCLGVAAHLAGFEKSVIYTDTLLNPGIFGASEVPEELLEIDSDDNDEECSSCWNQFSLVLSCINDGITKSSYENHLQGKDYVWKTLDPNNHDFSQILTLHFTFNQIADFIEDNCEFYETKKIKKF